MGGEAVAQNWEVCGKNREAEEEGRGGLFCYEQRCCLKVSFSKWDTSMANPESPESKRQRAKKLIGGWQWHPKNIQQKKADEPNRTHSKVVDFNPAPQRRDFPIRHVGWPLQLSNFHRNWTAPKRWKADIVKPGKKAKRGLLLLTSIQLWM